MRLILSVALFVACAGLAGGAPPTIEFPAENRPVNGYVIVTPKTDAVSITYVALDGVYPFPSDQLRDPKTLVLPANGLKDGTYKFMAVGASKTGEQSSKLLVVTIGKGGDTKPPVVVDPPVEPPPASGKYFFLVVRPDGPASAEFSKAMALPEWQTLRAAGHKVNQRTATEAASIGAVVPASQLPAVVTLSVSADGKTSTIVAPARPFPTTGPAVLKLTEVK